MAGGGDEDDVGTSVASGFAEVISAVGVIETEIKPSKTLEEDEGVGEVTVEVGIPPVVKEAIVEVTDSSSVVRAALVGVGKVEREFKGSDVRDGNTEEEDGAVTDEVLSLLLPTVAWTTAIASPATAGLNPLSSWNFTASKARPSIGSFNCVMRRLAGLMYIKKVYLASPVSPRVPGALYAKSASSSVAISTTSPVVWKLERA